MPILGPPPWEHAAESCGREISTNVLGRGYRAWFAQGKAREIYENHLQSRINNVSNIVSAEHAEISIWVYMIGKSPALSKPVIMVCCDDKEEGLKVKKALRTSQIVREFASVGFTFGRIERPLESPRPPRPLAGESSTIGSPEHSGGYGSGIPSKDVFSPSTHPDLGRPLLRSDPSGRLISRSTGGVILKLEQSCFQLTSEHTWAASLDDVSPIRGDDDDEDLCSIDGLEDESELPTSADDLDILSQGSVTPAPSFTSRSMQSLKLSRYQSWDESSDDEENPSSRGEVFSPRSPGSGYDTAGTSLSTAQIFSRKPLHIAKPVKIGSVSTRASEGNRPGLDYTLVKIPNPSVSDLVNGIVVPDGNGHRHLAIQSLSTFSTSERRIILVGQDGHVIHGSIMPSTILFKRRGLGDFENLRYVQLDGTVSMGDCGAAVLDADSGAFCGHLVRGCPGTGVAYIVPAVDTFEDLSRRGFQIKLGAPDGKDPTPRKDIGILSHDKQLASGSARREGSPICNQRSFISMKDRGGSPSRDRLQRVWHGHTHTAWSEADAEFLSLVNDMHSWDNSEDIWSLFCDDEDNSAYKVRVFRDFARGASLDTLSNSEPRSIWLDERESATMIPRPRSGVMSATGLMQALQMRRTNCGGLVDAERRLIYIDVLEPRVALILAMYCSQSEVSAVRDAMLRHLICQTHIGVSIQTYEPAPFSLSFHLPFFAWREHKVQSLDSRITAGNQPLRRSTNLSFLANELFESPRREVEPFLHKAQISIAIIGFSDTKWTGYCFADNFFDTDDETLSFCDHDEDIPSMDPISCGHLVADQTSPRDPREYFLLVVKFRVRRIKQEWAQVRLNLESSIEEELLRQHEALLYGLEIRVEAPRSYLVWYHQTAGLLLGLCQSLSDSLEAFKRFEDHHTEVLLDSRDLEMSEQGRLRRLHSLCDIRSTFREVEECLRAMNNLRERCKMESEQVHRHILWLAASRRGSERPLQRLTVLLFIFFPLLLAAMVTGLPTATAFQRPLQAFLILSSSVILAYVGYVIVATKYLDKMWQVIKRMFSTSKRKSSGSEASLESSEPRIMTWARNRPTENIPTGFNLGVR